MGTTGSLLLAKKLASGPILTFGLTGFGELVLLLVR